MIDTRQIVGYGADADPARRPGIPRERRPPTPEPFAVEPEPQRSAVTVFKHGRPGKTMPPVYGTAQPAAGISGRVRALAYAFPDHVTRHWMLLLVADRLDLWEHRAKRARGLGAIAIALLAGGIAYGALRRRSRMRHEPVLV